MTIDTIDTIEPPQLAVRRSLAAPGLSTVRAVTFAIDADEHELTDVTVPVRAVLARTLTPDDLALVWRMLWHLEAYMHAHDSRAGAVLAATLTELDDIAGVHRSPVGVRVQL